MMRDAMLIILVIGTFAAGDLLMIRFSGEIAAFSRLFAHSESKQDRELLEEDLPNEVMVERVNGFRKKHSQTKIVLCGYRKGI